MESANNNGKQDTFYFEPSNILPENKNTMRYVRLYQKIPVVALLGWAGAQDHDMEKQSKIYKELGYHTFRFSPSHELSIIYSNYTQMSYASKFLQVFKDNGLTANPIMVHMFSNASGFIIYQHIVKDTSECNQFFMKNHIGLIYDSQLSKPINLMDYSKAIMDQMGIRSTPIKYLSASVMYTFFKFYMNFIDYLTDDNFFKQILDIKIPPLLFLYSYQKTNDSIEQISNFIMEKKTIFPELFIKLAVYDNKSEYMNFINDHFQLCKSNLKDLHFEYFTDRTRIERKLSSTIKSRAAFFESKIQINA